MDRVLLYRIPRGGIPEEGIEEGAVIAARVPIYGTRDAGRNFWLKLQGVSNQNGFVLNKILPTLFTVRDDDGNIVAMMNSNVDDLLYGYVPGSVAFCLQSLRVRLSQTNSHQNHGQH